MDISLKIKELRNEKKLGSGAFADLIKVDRSQYSKLESGKLAPTVSQIMEISSIFNVSIDWLLTGKEPMLKTSTPVAIAVKGSDIKGKPIPLVNEGAAAGFGSASFAISEQDVKDYYIIPKFKYLTVDFMIEIHGSSMYPKYNSGDIIACTILRDRKFIQWNKCHIIATREQGILCKRIRPSDKTNCITAVSNNKEYQPFDIPEDDITGIALVVGVIRLE